MNNSDIRNELNGLLAEAEDDVFFPCIGIFGSHTHQFYLGAPENDAEQCEARQLEKLERIKNRNDRIRELYLLLNKT